MLLLMTLSDLLKSFAPMELSTAAYSRLHQTNGLRSYYSCPSLKQLEAKL